MATDSGIRRSVSAARSLARHWEQGQAAWLARLVAPLPPALEPGTTPSARALAALTELDPLSELEGLMAEPDAPPRSEPTGIGAGLREAVDRGLTHPPEPTSVIPRPRAGVNMRGAIAKDDAPAHNDVPARNRAPSEPADSPRPARHGIHKTALAAPRKQPAAAPAPDARQTAGGTPSALSAAKRLEGASPKPLSKARQLAEARKARMRERHLAQASAEPSRRSAASAPSIGARRADDLPQLGSMTRQASPAASHAPQLTAGGGNQPSPTPARSEEHATPLTNDMISPGLARSGPGAPPPFVQATNRPGPLPIEEIDVEVSPPPETPATPALAPRQRDDLAFQLADAAILHGLDLT